MKIEIDISKEELAEVLDRVKEILGIARTIPYQQYPVYSVGEIPSVPIYGVQQPGVYAYAVSELTTANDSITITSSAGPEKTVTGPEYTEDSFKSVAAIRKEKE